MGTGGSRPEYRVLDSFLCEKRTIRYIGQAYWAGGMVSGKLEGKVGGMPASVPTGSRIAGYWLEDRICAGAMAVVFRAVDERLRRRVALKVLPPELAADREFRERFIRESRAAAAVDDPHLIPVYEAGEADGVLFIAMRYVAGGDVRSLVRRNGPLSPERMAAIVLPVASALDAAHAAGLVHRDVKPANMLLDVGQGRPDHVYLADFGISRQMLSAAGLTGTGHFLGTADYCAPEQIQGLPVDGRADQYALACTVFELLSGQPPFRRDETAAVIWAQMTQPPPSLTSRQPGFPPAVDGVLAKALAKRPETRYSTCQEFADALRAALGLTLNNPGTPLSAQADRLQTGARHRAGDAIGWLATQNGPAEPTKDASISPVGIICDDRGQQRGHLPRHRSPHRRRSVPLTWMEGIGALAVASLVACLTLANPATSRSPFRSPGTHGAVTYSETVGAGAYTWNDYFQANGVQGQRISAGQTVQVSCRVRGYQVQDGNPWWYRIASPPWNNNFYASADDFRNNGKDSGSSYESSLVDFNVPAC
jgi:serine/threonine protein kinase